MRHLASIFCVLLLASCTWVNDDIDDCPYGFWLNLHYTKNILDVEAAQKYIKEVSVYVYDAEGNFVMELPPQTDLASNNYRVRVQGLDEGDYQFVVWSGIGNREYAISGGRSSMNEFRLSLAEPDSTSQAQLPDLYYGHLPTVHYDDAYASYDIDMMKNTNQLACLVVPTSQDIVMDPDDYTMSVVSANGTMDAHNRLVSDKTITYEPFIRDSATINDAEFGELHGLRFSIMTLRLKADTDARLILRQKSSGTTIFDVSFPEYIGMNTGRPLTMQEYLDRQDFYNIVFFLSGDISQLLYLQVNNWRLRSSRLKLTN